MIPTMVTRRRSSGAFELPPLPSHHSASDKVGDEKSLNAKASQFACKPPSSSSSKAFSPPASTPTSRTRSSSSLLTQPQDRKLKRRASLPAMIHSQQQQQQRQHFLTGIHVDTCDIREIPDPPPVTDDAAASVRKPKNSPFRDRTNATPQTSCSKKRSRLSLGGGGGGGTVLAPSPILTQRQVLNSQQTVDDDTVPTRSIKRRRQTLALSHEGASGGEVTVDSSRHATANEASNHSSPTSLDDRAQDATQWLQRLPSASQMDEIRALVHDYTLLNPEARAESVAAQQLLDRTGYCLPVPWLETTLSSPIKTRGGNQRDLLEQLGSNVHLMDECKLRDAGDAQAITHVKVERRGGYFLYYHEPSKRWIRPHQYEERYRIMLQEVNDVRSQHWKVYFDSLDCSLRNSGRGSSWRTGLTLEAYFDNVQSLSEIDPTQEWSEMQVRALEKRDEASPRKPIARMSRATRPRTVHRLLVGEDDSSDSEDDDSSEVEVGDPRNNDDMLLPIPSRDEISSDPEIAQIEAQLWSTIDQALEEYSRNFLAIRTRRERESAA